MNLNYSPIVFVSGCLLCPSLQAGWSEKKSEWAFSFQKILNDEQYQLIQMPCPESTFKNSKCGLNRKPHGIKFYEELPGFKEHCQLIACSVARQIVEFKRNGYVTVAVIGVEHSPTCAVNYMYTHCGMVKRTGIYIGNLQVELEKLCEKINFVGINRCYPNRAIKLIREFKQSKLFLNP